MTGHFPIKPLNAILEPIERTETPLPGREYRQVGVRLWGEGAYERESLDGSQTSYKVLSNLAMTSVTPVCTLADLILYAATRTALIVVRRRT
jgi:hypothetical protein